MATREWKVDLISPTYAEFDSNEYICETAGFVPLEVKFKRFEENGIRAQFQESDFDSIDIRNIYLHPDFAINQGDDLIDIEEKLAAREAYIQKLREEKRDIQERQDSIDNSAQVKENNDKVVKNE